MFSIEIELGDTWVAPVYDHVHHGHCFFLLEQARTAYMDRIGFPNDLLLSRGQAAVITAVAAKYKREVKRGRVSVTCEDLRVEGKTLIIGQRILNERGKVAVEATIESVFMDMTTRRGIMPPEGFIEAFLAGPTC
jgi:YbgC/YbaW family acyl-CoA thioester hydrolase